MLASAIMFAAALLGGAQESTEPPPTKCEVGPVEREYGGSSWLVYSCDNGGVVFVSSSGSPAAPSVFAWMPTANGFRITGETNSPDRAATDAAHAELVTLTQADLESLTAETRAVSAPPSQR